jgi:hypothetical protein
VSGSERNDLFAGERSSARLVVHVPFNAIEIRLDEAQWQRALARRHGPMCRTATRSASPRSVALLLFQVHNDDDITSPRGRSAPSQ